MLDPQLEAILTPLIAGLEDVGTRTQNSNAAGFAAVALAALNVAKLPPDEDGPQRNMA